MIAISELHQLSASEKLRIIEALWQDLALDESNAPSPSWHEAELHKTEAEFQAGKLEILDWQQAKAEMRKQFA